MDHNQITSNGLNDFKFLFAVGSLSLKNLKRQQQLHPYFRGGKNESFN